MLWHHSTFCLPYREVVIYRRVSGFWEIDWGWAWDGDAAGVGDGGDCGLAEINTRVFENSPQRGWCLHCAIAIEQVLIKDVR